MTVTVISFMAYHNYSINFFQAYLKWILFLWSRKFASMSKGLVYLMQMDTAYCMIKSQLHMPSIVRVALCSVCWGDYILSCIFMCLCVDIQEID